MADNKNLYKLEIERFSGKKPGDKQSLGTAVLYDPFGNVAGYYKTLELPDRDNKRNVSCIPEGTYYASFRGKEQSGSLSYDHVILHDVPNRSYILIHIANYYTDLKGCIGLGLMFTDIDKDGYRDISYSTAAFKQLMGNVPKDKGILVTIRHTRNYGNN
ncbi:MAG: DUF5675 family protein [Bacteroidales bacterium]|nr:DUF5675 family protein [Bacteroidales bacterium]